MSVPLINAEPYSDCVLDHRPKGRVKKYFEIIRRHLAYKYCEGEACEASCLYDEEIERLARICSRIRILDSNRASSTISSQN